MRVVPNNNYFYPWAFIDNSETPGRMLFIILLHRVLKNKRRCKSFWNAEPERNMKDHFVYFLKRVFEPITSESLQAFVKIVEHYL